MHTKAEKSTNENKSTPRPVPGMSIQPETATRDSLQLMKNTKTTFPNGVRRPQPVRTGGAQIKENNTGLPDNLKSGIESLSGFSMDDVKVHYNSSKPDLFDSYAYAQGANIHVSPGRERHLPHEAWHVVQQKQGRVFPTFRVNNHGINDNKSLEREANIMGHRALRTPAFPGTAPAVNKSPRLAGLVSQRQPIQRTLKDDIERNKKEIDLLSYIDIDKINMNLKAVKKDLADLGSPKNYTDVLNFYRNWNLLTFRIKNLERSKELALEIRKKNKDDVQKLDTLKETRKSLYQQQKEELVKNVISENVDPGENGWFNLDEIQLKIYSERVFKFLENIRHTDMQSLMLLREVNEIAKPTPDEKVEMLTTQINQIDMMIAELEDMPEDTLENQDIDALKSHRNRMELERKIQEGSRGIENVNINLLNAIEQDDERKDAIRVYMAVIAPCFEGKFKDIYQEVKGDKSKITYNENENPLWVSFGTPHRSLSWFQNYSLTRDGNNIPLIRSFLVPISYFETHMQKVTTENPDVPSGEEISSQDFFVKITDHNQEEKVYTGKVKKMAPLLTLVDSKYHNQAKVNPSNYVETFPDDPNFEIDLEKEKSTRESDPGYTANLNQYNKLGEDIKKKEKTDTYSSEYQNEHPVTDIDVEVRKKIGSVNLKQFRAGEAKKYLNLIDDQEDVSSIPQDVKEGALAMLRDAEIKRDIESLKNSRSQIEVEKTRHEAPINTIKQNLTDIQNKKTSEEKSYTRNELASAEAKTSSIIKDLFENAIEGSYRTIAVTADREYDHLEGREGPLLDYAKFMELLGLKYRNDDPVSHLLDQSNTALHSFTVKQDKTEPSWGSMSASEVNQLYSKMRFFYHKLDQLTQENMTTISKKEIDDVQLDQLDIARDSHLASAIMHFPNSPYFENIKKLKTTYESVNVEKHLGMLLDKNHLTPADVFGLPENLDADRADRHGNIMVKAAAETYFAEQIILSGKSLEFIKNNIDAVKTKLIPILNAETKKLEQEKKGDEKKDKDSEDILTNSYLQRDINEILGIKIQGTPGIKEEIPITKERVLDALDELKYIDQETDEHKRLRMVYLFFHILRPLSKKTKGTKKGHKEDPALKSSKQLNVNNRTEILDFFYYLNPQVKSFGILNDNLRTLDKERYMPYDKERSPSKFVPKEGNDMTDYMNVLKMPFVGGISGTTRDQSQKLETIYDKSTLKTSYWDLQILNAAFMIGNGYHSFFEAIYVAARFDHYTENPNIGEAVLAKFKEAKNEAEQTTQKNQAPDRHLKLYMEVLEIIDADRNIMDGFEKWYHERRQQAGNPASPFGPPKTAWT